MLATKRDQQGATPIHFATLGGHRKIVRLLVERGADINCTDREYLRELGGYLAFELEDLAYAIDQGDVRWVHRMLRRFPELRDAAHTSGKTFQQLARDGGRSEIIALFE